MLIIGLTGGIGSGLSLIHIFSLYRYIKKGRNSFNYNDSRSLAGNGYVGTVRWTVGYKSNGDIRYNSIDSGKSCKQYRTD